MLPMRSVDCPYCGETIELVIDDSVQHQQYIEDCSVCCRPINVAVVANDTGEIEIVCRTDDDT
jgi:hypothetical protein